MPTTASRRISDSVEMTRRWCWHMHELAGENAWMAGKFRVLVTGGCMIVPVATGERRHASITLDPQALLGPDRGRRLDPLSQLYLVAVDGARRDAGLLEVDRSRKLLREGVSLGTALGAAATSVRYARRLVKAGAAATN